LSNTRYRLPPLSALIAFESAARLSSFKDAAEELEVTPSSISQHVKTIERYLESDLFDRKHRGVELTQEGQILHRALTDGLNRFSRAIDEIMSMKTVRPVTIFTTTAMSSLWLTPRLSQFWKIHGDVSINQHVSDTDSYIANECDLKIWYGKSYELECESHLLFKDRLVPVCSPSYAAQLADHSLGTIAKQKLIHLDSATSWTTWPEWFETKRCVGNFSQGPRVNNYSIAVQAARDDVGFVLGWENLLAPLIQQGVLVAFDEHAIDAPNHFYLSTPKDRTPSEQTVLLKNWLIESSKIAQIIP